MNGKYLAILKIQIRINLFNYNTFNVYLRTGSLSMSLVSKYESHRHKNTIRIFNYFLFVSLKFGGSVPVCVRMQNIIICVIHVIELRSRSGTQIKSVCSYTKIKYIIILNCSYTNVKLYVTISIDLTLILLNFRIASFWMSPVSVDACTLSISSRSNNCIL